MGRVGVVWVAVDWVALWRGDEIERDNEREAGTEVTWVSRNTRLRHHRMFMFNLPVNKKQTKVGSPSLAPNSGCAKAHK